MDSDSTEDNDDTIMISEGCAYLRCDRQGGRAFFAFMSLFWREQNGIIQEGDHGYV